MSLPIGCFFGSFGVGVVRFLKCRGCGAALAPRATNPFCSDQCEVVWEAKP